MRLLGMPHDLIEIANAMMATTKSEVPISRLVDKLATKFQQQHLSFKDHKTGSNDNSACRKVRYEMSTTTPML